MTIPSFCAKAHSNNGIGQGNHRRHTQRPGNLHLTHPFSSLPPSFHPSLSTSHLLRHPPTTHQTCIPLPDQTYLFGATIIPIADDQHILTASGTNSEQRRLIIGSHSVPAVFSLTPAASGWTESMLPWGRHRMGNVSSRRVDPMAQHPEHDTAGVCFLAEDRGF